MKNLSPLSLLAGLALLGLIILAALHDSSETLNEVVTILVAAAAGNELPRAAALARSSSPEPAPAPAPAYPVSTK